MPAGRPPKYSLDYCDKLIECGKVGMTIAEASADLDIAISTIYKWRDDHEEFSEAFSRAQELAEAWWSTHLRGGLQKPPAEFQGAANLKYMAQRFRGWSEKTQHTTKDDEPDYVDSPRDKLRSFLSNSNAKPG